MEFVIFDISGFFLNFWCILIFFFYFWCIWNLSFLMYLDFFWFCFTWIFLLSFRCTWSCFFLMYLEILQSDSPLWLPCLTSLCRHLQLSQDPSWCHTWLNMPPVKRYPLLEVWQATSSCHYTWCPVKYIISLKSWRYNMNLSILR